MKTAKLTSFIAIAGLFTCLKATANPAKSACADCVEIQNFEQSLSKVQPNPLDTSTIDVQNALMDKGDDLAGKVLAKDALSPEEAAAIAKLMVMIAPYDNGLFSFQDNMERFSYHYNKKDHILKKAIHGLVTSKQITPKQERELLENMGLRPGHTKKK